MFRFDEAVFVHVRVGCHCRGTGDNAAYEGESLGVKSESLDKPPMRSSESEVLKFVWSDPEPFAGETAKVRRRFGNEDSLRNSIAGD